jgi:hypothetical protein
MKSLVVAFLLVRAADAAATECGELRTQVARMKAAQTAEEQMKRSAGVAEAKKLLREAQGKLDKACAPRKVGITALPLAYWPVPTGNLSKIIFELKETWGLTLTTRAGAAAGVSFDTPAQIEVPEGLKWETELSPNRAALDHLVAIATDAQLTVEEATPGKATWRIEMKAKPLVVPMSKLAGCAGGKHPVQGLTPHACKMLLAVDPLPHVGSVPERGRAVLHGEWQFGWHAGLDLDASTLGDPPANLPPARLDVALELSAPIPGISDGKLLHVSFEGNKQGKVDGAQLKLGHNCADDDEKCELVRFAAEVWYDRVFGSVFLRAPHGAGGKLAGKVTDRLARPVGGQRMRMSAGERRIYTITDERGDYRADGVTPGPVAVVPVGKDPANAPRGDETRNVQVGLGETKVPVTFVNKLWE